MLQEYLNLWVKKTTKRLGEIYPGGGSYTSDKEYLYFVIVLLALVVLELI